MAHKPAFKCVHRSSIVTRFLHKAAFCQSQVIFKRVYSRLFVARTSPKQQLSGLSLSLNQSIVQECVYKCVLDIWAWLHSQT